MRVNIVYITTIVFVLICYCISDTNAASQETRTTNRVNTDRGKRRGRARGRAKRRRVIIDDEDDEDDEVIESTQFDSEALKDEKIEIKQESKTVPVQANNCLSFRVEFDNNQAGSIGLKLKKTTNGLVYVHAVKQGTLASVTEVLAGDLIDKIGHSLIRNKNVGEVAGIIKGERAKTNEQTVFVFSRGSDCEKQMLETKEQIVDEEKMEKKPAEKVEIRPTVPKSEPERKTTKRPKRAVVRKNVGVFEVIWKKRLDQGLGLKISREMDDNGPFLQVSAFAEFEDYWSKTGVHIGDRLKSVNGVDNLVKVGQIKDAILLDPKSVLLVFERKLGEHKRDEVELTYTTKLNKDKYGTLGLLFRTKDKKHLVHGFKSFDAEYWATRNVKRHDRLVSIDGAVVEKMHIMATLLKGKPDTDIEVAFARGTQQENNEFSIMSIYDDEGDEFDTGSEEKTESESKEEADALNQHDSDNEELVEESEGMEQGRVDVEKEVDDGDREVHMQENDTPPEDLKGVEMEKGSKEYMEHEDMTDEQPVESEDEMENEDTDGEAINDAEEENETDQVEKDDSGIEDEAEIEEQVEDDDEEVEAGDEEEVLIDIEEENETDQEEKDDSGVEDEAEIEEQVEDDEEEVEEGEEVEAGDEEEVLIDIEEENETHQEKNDDSGVEDEAEIQEPEEQMAYDDEEEELMDEMTQEGEIDSEEALGVGNEDGSELKKETVVETNIVDEVEKGYENKLENDAETAVEDDVETNVEIGTEIEVENELETDKEDDEETNVEIDTEIEVENELETDKEDDEETRLDVNIDDQETIETQSDSEINGGSQTEIKDDLEDELIQDTDNVDTNEDPNIPVDSQDESEKVNDNEKEKVQQMEDVENETKEIEIVAGETSVYDDAGIENIDEDDHKDHVSKENTEPGIEQEEEPTFVAEEMNEEYNELYDNKVGSETSDENVKGEVGGHEKLVVDNAKAKIVEDAEACASGLEETIVDEVSIEIVKETESRLLKGETASTMIDQIIQRMEDRGILEALADRIADKLHEKMNA